MPIRSGFFGNTTPMEVEGENRQWPDGRRLFSLYEVENEFWDIGSGDMDAVGW